LIFLCTLESPWTGQNCRAWQCFWWHGYNVRHFFFFFFSSFGCPRFMGRSSATRTCSYFRIAWSKLAQLETRLTATQDSFYFAAAAEDPKFRVGRMFGSFPKQLKTWVYLQISGKTRFFARENLRKFFLKHRFGGNGDIDWFFLDGFFGWWEGQGLGVVQEGAWKK
jgi:hypothetical protein